MPRCYLLPLCAFALACACYVQGYTQKQNLFILVKDSVDQRPLSKATVVLLSRKDAAFVGFGITDSTGKYSFKNVNTVTTGSIAVSMAGYADKKLLLALPASGRQKQRDSTIIFALAPQFVALQDVVVGARANPIRMNKDTLEFDADFFKSQPNVVLEDLLRRLPGVEIRNSNEVYVNGQRVSRMLVDGKEFFSSDPIIVLKNLPADIISKVQVADDKKTIAKETRLQKDIPKTINLKLKKEIKKGVFGKFYGGSGTDKRYEAGSIVNTFRDTLQVSFIGSSNNQGSKGFTTNDLNDFGGFGRSDGLGSQSAGDIANRYNQGIETRHMAGVNANYNLGTTLQLNTQYFYNSLARREENKAQQQQLLGDTAQFSNSVSQALTKQYSQTASAALRWKQDSTGYLMIQVNADLGNSRDEGSWSNTTYSKNVLLLSKSVSAGNNRNNHHNLEVNANYSKTFVKRQLDWYAGLIFRNNSNNRFSNTDSRYSRISNSFLPEALLQQRYNNTPERMLYAENKFTKTWKERHSIIWRTEYTNNRKVNGGDLYQFVDSIGRFQLNPLLSVGAQQQSNWVNNQLYYRYSYKDLTIQPGISIRNLLLHYQFPKSSLSGMYRHYFLFTPTISVNYKGFSFDYDRHQQEPELYDIRPATDSTNPLHSFTGNPNLQAPINSYYTLSYYKYFEHARINLNTRLAIQNEKDAIVSVVEVATDGKTSSTRANFDHITNYNAWFNLSKSYSKQDWNYSLSLNGSYWVRQAPLLQNRQMVNTVRTTIMPYLQAFVSYQGNYRWTFSYNFNFNKVRSQDRSAQVADNRQHNISNSFYVKPHRRLWVDARITYSANPGIGEGFQKQWVFCDAAITAAFMNKEQAQLKLSAYDLFNQNQGIYRFTSSNAIVDYQALVQRRYFMLTFSYTIRQF